MGWPVALPVRGGQLSSLPRPGLTQDFGCDNRAEGRDSLDINIGDSVTRVTVLGVGGHPLTMEAFVGCGLPSLVFTDLHPSMSR